MQIISPKYDFSFKELLNNEVVRTHFICDICSIYQKYLQMICDMIRTKNMGIIEAIKEIKVMSLSKRMRLHYEARMKEIRDKHAREEYVRDEGIAYGLERGRQEEMGPGIQVLIKTCKEYKISQKDILYKMKEEYNIPEKDAKAYLEKYW